MDIRRISREKAIKENTQTIKTPVLNKHETKEIPNASEEERRVSNSFENPSLYYYKSERYGKGIENFQWDNSSNALFEIESITDDESFALTTIYPGLLVGSGYNHPVYEKVAKNTPEENVPYQLGFSFDHTTGLPVIAGSSIKGLMRSLFAPSKTDFLCAVFDRKKDELEALEKKLFTTQQVIFYDAYIVGTNNDKSAIFGSDYITSHYSDEELGEFREPNPVKFLKILPEVTFRFQIKGTSEDDLTLIKSIVLTMGLGAKTNVGYGQFRE